MGGGIEESACISLIMNRVVDQTMTTRGEREKDFSIIENWGG